MFRLKLFAAGLGLLAALQTVAPPGNAQTPTDAEVRALIGARITKNAAKGIAVALISPNGATRIIGVGKSGNSQRPVVDGDTIFEVGSITKTFTGTMLAQMVSEGRLSLDDTVRRYAPKGLVLRQPGIGDVTLRQLASHTSGLPRLPMDLSMAASMLRDLRDPYAHYDADSLWRFVATTAHDPAKTYPPNYSNLGMGLLGEILALREGTDFATLVSRRILVPLAMNTSGIATAPAAVANLARGHSDSLAATPFWQITALPGAGAIRSSANEMALYIKAQRDQTINGARDAQAGLADMSKATRVGLAWMTTSKHDDQIVWHNGGTGGFRSFAGFSKISGWGVVVLANSTFSVDDIGLHLLNSKFELGTDPREVGWVGIIVWVALLIAIFGGLYRLRIRPIETPVQAPIQTPTGRWMGKPKVIACRWDAVWFVAHIGTIAMVTYYFSPWYWVGETVRNLVLLAAVLGVVHLIWRARSLPWPFKRPPADRSMVYFERVILALMLTYLMMIF